MREMERPKQEKPEMSVFNMILAHWVLAPQALPNGRSRDIPCSKPGGSHLPNETKSYIQARYIIMLKRIGITKLFFLSLTLLFVGNVQAQDPANFEMQIDASVNYWNTNFTKNVVPINWFPVGTIIDDAHAAAVIDQMTDPNSVYVTSGNAAAPDTVGAVSLATGTAYEQAQWKGTVSGLVQAGQLMAIIEWVDVNTGDTFESLAVGDSNGIVFDPMFSTIALVDTTRAGGGRRITWVWGSTRGRINWDVKCVDGICVKTCNAWMSLGEAKIECKVEKIDGVCKLTYAYGWRTPTGDIEIEWDPKDAHFKVTITGLGSSGQGNGCVVAACK
jgi:hypothetical protein